MQDGIKDCGICCLLSIIRFYGGEVSKEFKNTLIDLHLDEKQLKKLNENLDFALENMEEGLSDILTDYVNDEEDVKNE